MELTRRSRRNPLPLRVEQTLRVELRKRKRKRGEHSGKVRILVGLILGTITSNLWQPLVCAQITPDNTLGTESSVINSDVELNEKLVDLIEGGAIRDANLFHSFEQFNLTEGQNVYFANPAGIENILTRVTGIDASKILGTLGVNGAANLFLLNPNGIIFGENASLDMGGSFAASTADAIQFGDRGFFSATEPEQPPLLTVQPSAFFFNQINPGRIENRSTAPIGIEQLGTPLSGLRVPDGKSLLLVGGDIIIDGGGLNALDGRIGLFGVAGSGTAELNFDNDNLSLSIPETIAQADISLFNEAVVNTSGEGGGSMQIESRNLILRDKSFIFADTLGNQDGNGISIKADLLRLEDGSLITVDVLGSGKGGNLTVEASESVQIIGESETSDSALASATFGEGNAGELTITTKQLVVEDGGLIDVNTSSTGNAGNLTIEVEQLSIRDSQVSASSSGEGNAGDLNVRAADFINISGKKVFNDIENPAGLFAQVNIEGKGRSGNLNIETERLSISNGGTVQAATFGKGDAGNLLIRASEINVFNTPENLFPTGILAGVIIDPDETVNLPQGNGGNLKIETERLKVEESIVSVTTSGVGNAGTLEILASESVEVIGKSPNGSFRSQISGAVTADAIGNGGDLSIETGQMIVRDGAEVSVSSLGSGLAGNLNIKTRSLSLDNQGTITATTRSGDGGNITIKGLDLLLLRSGSQISTTAGTAESGGDGGDINIAADLIVAIPQENSDITANAFTGQGGNVQITAQGILGIEFRPAETSLSDITASSEFGVSGTVVLNTPDVDVLSSLVKLPEQLINVQPLEGCRASSGQGSSFVRTGKGGLPSNPDELLESTDILDDLSLPQGWSELASEVPKQIVQATGWIINEEGTVELVAHKPNCL